MNVAHVILGLQVITFGFQLWTFFLIWRTQKILNNLNKPVMNMQQPQARKSNSDPNIPAFDARRRPPV